MLSATDQRRVVEDLYNELRWMLVAASQWHAHRHQQRQVQLPSHFDVLSLDSACLHIRALYEFFIDRPPEHQRPDTAYACRDFGVTLSATTHYTDYIDSLNKRLLHIDTYRPAPTNRLGAPVLTDLNEKVVDLALDVLGLWDAFVAQLPHLSSELNQARHDAIADAEQSARSAGGDPVFR